VTGRSTAGTAARSILVVACAALALAACEDRGGLRPKEEALDPPAPIAGRDRHAAVWTGSEMLVFGGCCRHGRHHRDGLLYSPR
jgi:hypothetical protein